MLQNVWDDRFHQIPRLEAEEAMRLANIMTYPTLTTEGSAKMWKGWEMAATAKQTVQKAVGSLRRQFDELRLWAAENRLRL